MVYRTKKKKTWLQQPKIILKTPLSVLTFSFSKAKKLKFLTTIAQVTAVIILNFLIFSSRQFKIATTSTSAKFAAKQA